MTYKVQIDNTIRNATTEEIARIKEIEAETQQRLDAIAAQSSSKISAKTKLKTLGLTDEEIAALVG